MEKKVIIVASGADALRIKNNYNQGSGMDLLWKKIFPEKEYYENIDVLIAGCGTNQAVFHAMKFPNSKNYAIDISAVSYTHLTLPTNREV